MRLPSLGPRGEGWLLLQVVLLVLMMVTGFVAPHAGELAVPAPEPIRMVGRAVLIGGLALIGWASATLHGGGSFAAVPRPRADGTLVVSGPYRVLRHPLYSGLVLTGLGTTLARLSWIELVLTAALFVVLDLKRRREETWLLERYPGYAAYRLRTKALVPYVY